MLHTYIHTYIHACMHAYMNTCINAYMHTCMHAYKDLQAWIYIDTYVLHTSGHANLQTGRQTDRQTEQQKVYVHQDAASMRFIVLSPYKEQQ